MSRTMSDRMDEYHEYLTKNYKYGVDRFFAPTGFLKSFEKSVEVSASQQMEAVYASNMDEACTLLEPVVQGGEGVFDLVAEPGTGKTTVLPFRFPSKRVVVALPSPFDAWSAYNTASGEAKLKLKGLSLGKDEKVCYMDSYMAANMVMSGFMNYDVLIVDECDSGKGVTGFLAGVKTPGKVLIRMSASHGRSSGGPSSSFVVTEVDKMPDVRNGSGLVAQYVRTSASGRCLVMAPDADVAASLAAQIPGSKLITSKVPLGELSRTMTDRSSSMVFVTDDTCSRGLNLDLDMVFDCQLVGELGVIRNLTEAELYQRKRRVGRNRAGFYFSPGLSTMEPRLSDADVMRSNVVRAHASVPQEGHELVRVSASEAMALLLSEEEPYVVQTRVAEDSHMLLRSPSSSVGSTGSIKSRSSGTSSSSAPHKRTGEVPAWMVWAATASGKTLNSTCYSISNKGLHRTLSSSDEEAAVDRGAIAALRPRVGALAPKEYKFVSTDGPRAVSRRHGSDNVVAKFVAPRSPPVMDLSASEYELDWPSLLGDLMERCSDMPTIVPPHGWQHTTVGGLGSNWVARVESLAVSELAFTAAELELVCRAWNTIVAGTWVKKSPGLSAFAHRDQLEFCLRYFQSYFNLAVTG